MVEATTAEEAWQIILADFEVDPPNFEDLQYRRTMIGEL